MPRTQRTLRPDEPRAEVVDTLLLKFDERRRQQGFAFGGKGICVEFDFPTPPRLRTDDLLVLDDGTLVEVVADVEPVLEIRSKDFAAMARLILALGNRHVPVQILANRMRVLRSAETAALAAEHGIEPALMTAPFEPDDSATPDGDYRHGHAHGHHHDHAHGPGQEHEHSHGHEHRAQDHGHSQGHTLGHADNHEHDRAEVHSLQHGEKHGHPHPHRHGDENVS
jgi:urease accessory protein